MKRLFLSLLFCIPFLTQADLMDDLDQAIRESNVEQIKALLPQVNLSEHEQVCLVDLSQQIVNYNKGQFECYMVNPSTSTKAAIAAIGSIYSFVGFILCTGFGLLCTCDEASITKESLLLFFGGGSCLASSVILFKYFSRYRTNCYNTLKTNFDNALKVKQLLLRYKPIQ